MTVLNPTFQNDIHFPIRVSCAIAALIAVAVLWGFGVPDIQTVDAVATVAPQDCVAQSEECLQLWINENLSNIQQPIGVLGSDAIGSVD